MKVRPVRVMVFAARGMGQVTIYVLRCGGKVFHFVMRRRLVAGVGGVCIMYGSGLMMEYRPPFVSHLAWETLAFFIHGVGAIPLAKPFEHAWSIAMATQVAEVAENA